MLNLAKRTDKDPHPKPPPQNYLRPPHPETECQLGLTSAQGHGVFSEAYANTADHTVLPQTSP